MSDNTAKWTALCAPFKDDEIELLPKYTGPKDANGKPTNPRQQCQECGGYHAFPCVHLAYVGHAGLTMRLNEVAGPDGWSWEPMGFTPSGTPAMADGGMWIRMTILGVTKIGFGDAQGKTGPNATKEIIGDALRNAAMRFGIATYLWGKSDKAKAELVRQGIDDDEPAGVTHGAGEPPVMANLASDKQVKAIYALSKKLGWSDEYLHGTIKRTFGKEHAGDLTGGRGGEASRLIEFMEAKKNAPTAEDIQAELGAEDLTDAPEIDF